jgi:hypothetical protein
VELRIAAEQLGGAGATSVDPVGLGVGVLAGARTFGARLAKHIEGNRVELGAHLRIVKLDGVGHTVGTDVGNVTTHPLILPRPNQQCRRPRLDLTKYKPVPSLGFDWYAYRVNHAQAAERLSVLHRSTGASVQGVRLRPDEDLGGTVADVLWLVPAPQPGAGWVISELDELCDQAQNALGEEVVAVYCRYRTPEEMITTAELDEIYFQRVAA